MDILRNKRILVTGGNGYLGSHLTRYLKTVGAKVYILDFVQGNNKNEYVVDLGRAKTKNLEKIAEEVKPHIIYHLAAVLNRERSFEHHDHIMKVNYFGTIKLLKALQKVEYENFIFTSTGEIYGNNSAPFHERQIPDACSPYSLSKIFSEQAITAFSSLYKKKFTVLRLFNFFGRNMPDHFFIPQLIYSLQHNIPFNMTGGEQVRDYLYVDDVVLALILTATNENSINEVFNLCSGVGITLKDMVSEFKRKFKKECAVNFGALPYRKNEIWNMVGNNEKIKEALGFEPQYSLEEAIELLLNE
jgi:nucleoside-diphosphate-sugar epimerase